jgi:hypothetical protein
MIANDQAQPLDPAQILHTELLLPFLAFAGGIMVTANLFAVRGGLALRRCDRWPPHTAGMVDWCGEMEDVMSMICRTFRLLITLALASSAGILPCGGSWGGGGRATRYAVSDPIPIEQGLSLSM